MSDDNITEMFVDGIANVNLSLGAFRFDLVTIKSPAQADQEQPELSNKVRVVMTPQGYLQTVTALKNFLEQVEEKGIIRREQVVSEDAVAEDKSKK